MIEEIRKRQDRLITSVNQTQSPEISVSDNDDKTNQVSQSAK